MPYKDTNLWRRALESREDDSNEEARVRLATALDQFRSKAEVLAEEVSRTLPGLTDHSVRHADILWEIGGLIAGPGIDLNPTEAFVFGGAALLHDLGNAVAAYPGGLADLKGPVWDDLVHAAFQKSCGRSPKPEECEDLPPEILQEVLLQRLRQVHADRAEVLATQGFYRSDNFGQPIYLLDDERLREDLGPIIGRIASSHHWEISRVVQELTIPFGTSPDLPLDWSIDALTLACLLRVADAAHLDSRRAPSLMRVLRDPQGTSRTHWEFQGRLLRPVVHEDQLVFTSKGEFPLEEREAWWLCYETLQGVDQELRRVDAVMRRERRARRFAARSVANVDNPQVITRHIPSKGWEPVEIKLHISDVLGVIDRFGGKKLYGDKPTAALREMIANSADAVRARRQVEERDPQWGAVRVRLGAEGLGWWLEVEDNGIGMSEEVLRGSLLDFGTSYWRSELARREHPGLLSSGFAPTGRFGIGFFSVFMLGPRIRVVSRPWGAGANSVRVLEIAKGHESRPSVRMARTDSPDERIVEGGTRVRVWLEQDPFHQGGLLGRPSGLAGSDRSTGSTDRPDILFRQLCRVVGRVAPALDVEVRCSLDTEANLVQTVVQPNDWMEMPFDSLVERLGGDHGWRRTKIRKDLWREGKLVARVGLRAPSQFFGATGVITVGGLAAREGIATFEGVVVGTDPSLNRADADALLTEENLAELLQSPGSLIVGGGLNWGDRLHFAQLFLNVGDLPESLPCFILGGGATTMNDLRSWLRCKEPGDEVVMVTSDRFELDDGMGSTHDISFDMCVDHWEQPEQVVIVGAVRPGQLLPGFPTAPSGGVVKGIESNERPRSLAHCVIEAAAAEWRSDVSSLLDTSLGVLEERSIGWLHSDALSGEIVVECFVFQRPSA